MRLPNAKKKSLRRRVAVTAFIVSVFGMIFCWIAGSVLTAPVNQKIGPAPAELKFQPSVFSSKSGSQIAAWHGAPAEPRGVLVLVHSLRGDRRSMVERARFLLAAGYATVLIDLQAHGESPGQSIAFGYLEKFDVEAATAFARNTYPGLKVGVVGVSLGGASALLASPLKIDALVLESVYPTIEEAVQDRLSRRLGPLSHLIAPALLLQLWPRLGSTTKDLRPIDSIAKAGCPVLVMAGDADPHTTLAETQRIFQTAIEPKQLVLFEGAGHVDLLNYDPSLYKNKMIDFLEASFRARESDSKRNVKISNTPPSSETQR